MTENPSPIKASKSFRKGALVFINRSAYQESLEYLSSDQSPPDYIFEGPGEILIIKGDYAQVRWRRPVPDVWFKIDTLEEWSE